MGNVAGVELLLREGGSVFQRQAPPLLKVDDEAALLGVSRSTLYRLAAAGDVPTIRVGHSLRFDHRAVLAALGAS